MSNDNGNTPVKEHKRGAWKPGVSGNPNGRPPKRRALTELLNVASGRRISYGLDHKSKTSRKRFLAEAVWRLLTEGEVEFTNGEKLKLNGREYVQLVQWLYNHMDGPPRLDMDLSTLGEQLAFKVYAGIDEDEV